MMITMVCYVCGFMRGRFSMTYGSPGNYILLLCIHIWITDKDLLKPYNKHLTNNLPFMYDIFIVYIKWSPDFENLNIFYG